MKTSRILLGLLALACTPALAQKISQLPVYPQSLTGTESIPMSNLALSTTTSYQISPAAIAAYLAGRANTWAALQSFTSLSLGGTPLVFGTAIGDTPLIINFQGGGRPGLYLQNGGLTGGLVFGRTAPTSEDAQDFLVVRSANYSGGSHGFVNAAISGATTTTAGTTSYEWAGVFVMNNNGNAADASENLALNATSRKYGTGATWGSNIEMVDTLANPTTTSVTDEHDLYANGTDTNGVRVMLDMDAGNLTDAGLSGGTNPTITYGLRIGPVGGNASPHAAFVNQIYTQGLTTNVFKNTGTSNTVIEDAGTSVYGISFDGLYSSGPIRVHDNAPFIWNTAQTVTQEWNSSNGCISFLLSGVSWFCSGPTTTTINGVISLPSLPSGGGVTGYVCYNASTGQLTYDTTAACPSSSERFKRDIEDLGWGALAQIWHLRSVSYRLQDQYNPQHLGPQLGFLAEDVAKVEPRLVEYDKAGKPLTVIYERVTALLVRAMQAQQRQIFVLAGALALCLLWCAHLHRSLRRLQRRVEALAS
jgi:Chaperone of endosialidase